MKDRKAEVEDYQRQTMTRPGTVVGRPAGKDAYHGNSAMNYQRQSSGKGEQVALEDQLPVYTASPV